MIGELNLKLFVHLVTMAMKQRIGLLICFTPIKVMLA